MSKPWHFQWHILTNCHQKYSSTNTREKMKPFYIHLCIFFSLHISMPTISIWSFYYEMQCLFQNRRFSSCLRVWATWYIYIYPPQGSTFKYVYGIIWRYHSKDRLIALIDRVCCALPDCSEYAIKRWIGFKRPSWVLLYTALSISGSKKQPQCPFLYLSHTGGDLVTRMYVVEDISKCWQK